MADRLTYPSSRACKDDSHVYSYNIWGISQIFHTQHKFDKNTFHLLLSYPVSVYWSTTHVLSLLSSTDVFNAAFAKSTANDLFWFRRQLTTSVDYGGKRKETVSDERLYGCVHARFSIWGSYEKTTEPSSTKLCTLIGIFSGFLTMRLESGWRSMRKCYAQKCKIGWNVFEGLNHFFI